MNKTLKYVSANNASKAGNFSNVFNDGLGNSLTLKTCSETRKDQFEYAKVIKISQNEITGKGLGKKYKALLSYL